MFGFYLKLQVPILLPPLEFEIDYLLLTFL